jgi:penicillin-binding protein 1C
LGNGSVRLLDLANAYACLARGGEWRPYRLVEGRTEERKNGNTEEKEGGRAGAEAAGRRIFSPEAAWLIADMLSGDERATDTTGHHADVRLPKIAWKTGTSSGFRDAWAVGFNPEYVVAVWIGNPDGRASPALVGARAAVPVMWDIVRGLYPANDSPWFALPPGMKKRPVCAVSGLPAGAQCPRTEEDWCIAGVSSAAPCDVHRLCRKEDGEGGMEVREVWPAPVEAFLRRRTAAAPGADSATGAGDAPPRLVSPRPGMVLRLVDGMAANQRLTLRAESGAGVLYWFVDDQLAATAPAAESASWPLARGRHVIVCCDAAGRSARAEIVVE